MKLTKSSLGRKEFHLTAHRSQVITEGSQGGNLRQEPKQKLRRNIAYWLSFHVWFSLLSQDPCPGVVMSCRCYHIKKMLHRHANSPVWWRALLNWGPSPKWLEFVLRWQKPTSSLSEVIQAYSTWEAELGEWLLLTAGCVLHVLGQSGFVVRLRWKSRDWRDGFSS